MTYNYQHIFDNRYGLKVDAKAWASFVSWPWWFTNHSVFLVRIKDIHWKISLVQSELERTGLFIPFESDYLHATLKWGWLYSSKKEVMKDVKKYVDDEISFSEEVKPFELVMKWLNFFSNVIFVKCFDQWMLAAIHRELILYYDLDIKQRRDLDNFIPHIAIWTYKREESNDELFKLWDVYQDYEFWSCNISSIDLCDVIRTKEMKFPKIEIIKSINL